MSIFHTNKYLRYCAIAILRYIIDMQMAFGIAQGTAQERNHHTGEFIVKTICICFVLGVAAMILCLILSR